MAAGTRASSGEGPADGPRWSGSSPDLSRRGDRTLRDEIRRDLRNDQRHDAVGARVGDVQEPAARRVGDARRRAEGEMPFVADVADDAVGPEGHFAFGAPTAK